MSRRVRLVLFLLAAAAVVAVVAPGITELPAFGSVFHPYRDATVAAGVAHATPNIVSTVNYDVRAFDTFVEETILLGSVAGAAALLRPDEQERSETEIPDGGAALEVTRLVGYLVLPVTILVGLDLVAHGHLTPGGGFQGGVVLATGLHLLYLTGQHGALQRARPVPLFDVGEAVGTAAFAAVGLAGLAVAGAFLTNVLPFGSFGTLPSSGTVIALNVAVGLAVASGVVVLIAAFLDQALRVPHGHDR